MAIQTGREDSARRADLRRSLVAGLGSCATEADIVQVLYGHLRPEFGYDTVNLAVLERGGWYHDTAVDHGVLQDPNRRRLSESVFARYYERHEPVVLAGTPDRLIKSRGPGTRQQPLAIIWVPLLRGEAIVGSVSYQLYTERPVAPDEVAFLEGLHVLVGALVDNAHLNEMTRNQTHRLAALNSIARALSSTHDEPGVVSALQAMLFHLVDVDILELAVRDELDPNLVRVHTMSDGSSELRRRELRIDFPALGLAREVLAQGRPRLRAGRSTGAARVSSAVSVPVVEGEHVRAALTLKSRKHAYEESTLEFVRQVADQVSLALRNAWSYQEVESQKHRLEVVNAVGRRLASSLDRWAITRTLREELEQHLDFDIFSLAIVTSTPKGTMADGYVYDTGREQRLRFVPLEAAGPAREAFETGRSILVRRSPWAAQLERERRGGETQVHGDGVVLTVTRPPGASRVAARSLVWVPVRRGAEIIALMSLQSYREDAFDGWHVRVLEDVAAHVSLALATADHFDAAQAERRRLEALHVLELGVAGAVDERQIAEAVFEAAAPFLETLRMSLVCIDPQGRLTGYVVHSDRVVEPLGPLAVDDSKYFQRLVADRSPIAETVPGAREQVLCAPLIIGDRVTGALAARRYNDWPFSPDDVRLLESAARVVGIAMRTVRLHRANELALAHSVRIQEVAALAGSDLQEVVTSIADQARVTLGALGTACWALDDELRVAAAAWVGDRQVESVLAWSGRSLRPTSPGRIIEGTRGGLAWTLVPLWYADRLVGALGSISSIGALDEPAPTLLDFARHAAIAIENARLAAETRGRIHTLEAVAAFADLDITKPHRTRQEMCKLVERALHDSNGALWMVEGDVIIHGGGDDRLRGRLGSFLPRSALGPDGSFDGPPRLGQAIPDKSLDADQEEHVFRVPITVEGEVVGMLTADTEPSSPTETRRLMGVLAAQVALVMTRLQLVAQLDRQASQLKAMLEHAPVGVVLEDSAGKVVYANPVIERIYGIPAGSLTGRPAGELAVRAGAVTAADRRNGQAPSIEYRISERATIVQVRRVSIPRTNQLAASVLSLHEDVTEERAALEAKDLMLRAVGHEVRSPAAAMRNTIASLLEWENVMDPEERHTLTEEAYEQSDRLLSLVESQLIIAKLEAGRFEPEPGPVLLAGVLQQVESVLRSRHGHKVDRVDVELPPGLPRASCEAAHLEQVLTNLLSNALEYTNATRVRVTARARGDWLEITVSDNGPGLPAERVANVFEKTMPAGRNRSRGGLGLGLYLCRLVVERSFGGRIWLQRTGRAGTTFKFTLPAVRPEPAALTTS